MSRQSEMRRAKGNGLLASNALIANEIPPASANCIEPNRAEALPEFCLKRAIAKVVVFGIIKPSIPIIKNNKISNAKNPKSKKPTKISKIAIASIVKKE